ncbi:gliding motility-associated C-terminal domain-containing protein [Chitinophaga jiangningensis]|uniref:Gliding motility-associated C-terminal domain-containing protein n=1 Tax=Chitinophaga jiangningensis TaxID=1419482 RepID=A0A1M6W092_9BACT|nr:gliding motility-associated C-terminal domain-containing protein [Chitinophaga jiangningensis]SHK87028.1 gliding motility-associated C-terminal domain-containing protein [Chitinophaga jiangningensis]
MKFTLPIGFVGTIIGLLLFTSAMAQQTAGLTNYSPLNFAENKGQWDSQVRYKSDLDAAAVFLLKDGFRFVLQHPEDLDKVEEFIHGHVHKSDTLYVNDRKYVGDKVVGTIDRKDPFPTSMPTVRNHAYTVSFVNANPNVLLEPEKKQEFYNNYFIGDDRSKWASHVSSYQGVNYISIYKNIDAHVYSEASKLKYDMIVHPGGNPDEILLNYDGATGMEIKKGQLIIHTTVGDVTEQLPYAYQYVNGERVSVKVSYKLNGNKVGFKINGSYNKDYDLIIDPVYVFSTVSGSRSDNWGFTATYDDDGFFYGGGIVFGRDFPVTNGAYQTAYGGGEIDIGIQKFTPNGTGLVYCTFIGGSGAEQPHSLFVNRNKQLVISGRTKSGNYPMDKLIGKRGGWDIAVSMLSADGASMVGSLVIGGSADDGVNMRDQRAGGATGLLRNYGDDARSEVVVDGAGYIYVASCTRSSDFPATGGAFQTTHGGGQDGVVLKINPICQDVVWASYLGGRGDDAAFVIALNDLQSLYVAGGTNSDDFKVTGSVAGPTFTGGACDGFIAHLSSDGSSILQATYVGSTDGQADQIYGIQLDNNGYVYVTGTTEGVWPIKQPTGTATFFNQNSAQFIMKYQPNLSDIVYSTTFGKARTSSRLPSISPTAFLVDRCENVYVSGWGGGINPAEGYPNSGTGGLPLKNPLQSLTDGMDFYFIVLQKDVTDILFGSYFGGAGLFEHVDGGTSRFDRNGIIYQGICAWCQTGSDSRPRYPTTPGAYSSTPPRSCNYGALKIAFNLDGVKAGIKTLERKNNYCVPETITFIDTTQVYVNTSFYRWDFGDGSPEVTGNALDTVSHAYPNVGTYIVRLIKSDASTCNGADTAYIQVKLGTNRATLDLVANRLPPCESLQYEFLNNSNPGSGAFRDSSFIFNYGDGPAVYVLQNPPTFPFKHTYPAPGLYNVSLMLRDTNFCNAPEVLNLPLRVAVNVKAQFEMPDTVCVGETIKLDNTSLGGQTFVWTFGDDNSQSTDAYPLHTFNIPGTFDVKLVATDLTTCNEKDSIVQKVLVAPLPVADFEFLPNKAVENTPVTFTNNSTGAQSYLWNFGDGDTTSVANPVHQFNTTGTFTVCLTASNPEGCAHTTCKDVNAIVVPLFDVPNAFSPNNDGINDVFYIKAFAVAKFNLKIFSRWGQLIFETNDFRQGWDGKFKGEVMPMDAYAYVVSIEFNDGTKGNRQGSVTLLR